MQPDRPLKILMLGLNYAPEMIGIAVYTQGLAESLAQRGHDVHVIAGKPYYPTWKVFEGFRSGWKRRGVEGRVDVTRLAHYVPNIPTGARRILHHASFALSSLIPTVFLALWQQPDIVMTIAPSLMSAPVAWLAARLCGARCWLHIQDFEVEAAMATGLVSSSGMGARAALWFESVALRLFDRVSSISPAMCRKLLAKGLPAERVVEFRNWADVANISPIVADSSYRAELGISTPYVALYSGNIANKQGIDIVVAAARRLRHRSDLTFVVCGEGPNRANLEAQAVDFGNIQFRDLQPKDRLCDLLGLATVHLLPQLASAADLVLPSKLANMLASGRATVATAHPGTGLAAEIEGCGLVVPPEDEAAFANAIERLLDDPEARTVFSAAARCRAEERWEREVIVSDFEAELLDLAQVDRSVAAASVPNGLPH